MWSAARVAEVANNAIIPITAVLVCCLILFSWTLESVDEVRLAVRLMVWIVFQSKV